MKPKHDDLVPCDGFRHEEEEGPAPLAHWNADYQWARCEDCQEAAYDRYCDKLYEGGGGVTIEEQYQAAAAAKRSLK